MDHPALRDALDLAAGLLAGRPALALALAEKAAALAPDRPEPPTLAGRALIAQGRPEDALERFGRALALAPGHVPAALAAADLLRAGGRLPEAEALLQAALDEDLDARETADRLMTIQRERLDDLLARSRIVEQSVRPRDWLVTAMVSTYRSAEFMEECLADLEKQTLADRLEIIVVDAASPEAEGEIVAAWQKRHDNIRYVRTPERIGIYDAWNLAVRLARGRFLTPFSANDRLRDRAYEILADALAARPEAVLAYGDTILTGRPHETFEEHFGREVVADAWRWPPFSYPDLLVHCRVGPHPLWRREVHEEFGYFDQRYPGVADYAFWLKLARRRPLLHVPEFTGLAWLTDQALSAKDKNEADLASIRFVHCRQLRREELRLEAMGDFAEAVVARLEQGDRTAALALYRDKRSEFGHAPELADLDRALALVRQQTGPTA